MWLLKFFHNKSIINFILYNSKWILYINFHDYRMMTFFTLQSSVTILCPDR